MTRGSRLTPAVFLIVLICAAGALWLLLQHGFSARPQPTRMEAFVARHLRHLAVPRRSRDAKNPIAATPEVLAEAQAHFADHCAICHANDGGGETNIGRNLYPKAPDMRQADTQSLRDGELFYIIHNGIRFTGMPAWGDKQPEEDEDSWKLVHFIRHMPRLTKEELEEMKRLNPISRQELEEEKEIDRFLQGEETSGEPRSQTKHH